MCHIVVSQIMAQHIHPLIGSIYRTTLPVPEDTPKIQGYDFNKGVDHKALLQSYLTTGFQATNFGLAVKEIKNMVSWMVHGENFGEYATSIFKVKCVRFR